MKQGPSNSRWFFGVAPVLSLFMAARAMAQTNSSLTGVGSAQMLMPNATGSIFRVFGALVFVIGIFFAGIWLFKNWQRLSGQRGRAPKLNVLETRSLGGRQAIYVVGYEHERFLIASSPAGISLLSPLAPVSEVETVLPEKSPLAPSFAQALSQVLKGK